MCRSKVGKLAQTVVKDSTMSGFTVSFVILRRSASSSTELGSKQWSEMAQAETSSVKLRDVVFIPLFQVLFW